jgi:hypothetical protein
MGIDAALCSGSKCYFFAGDEYIRVTRGMLGRGRSSTPAMRRPQRRATSPPNRRLKYSPT